LENAAAAVATTPRAVETIFALSVFVFDVDRRRDDADAELLVVADRRRAVAPPLTFCDFRLDVDCALRLPVAVRLRAEVFFVTRVRVRLLDRLAIADSPTLLSKWSALSKA
jgi:hypothetical protein